MAFKLNAAETKERNEIAAALLEAHSNLEEAHRVYAEKFEAMKSFVESRCEDWRGEFDEKSENWQESDRGQEVSSFVEEWENFRDSLDDPENELPELPEFEELPEGVS